MRFSPRRLLGIIATLVCCIGLVVVVTGGGSPAGAFTGPYVEPGRGVWVANHTGFVGYYRAYVAGRWTKVYCVSPGRPAPTRITLTTVWRAHGTTRFATRLLAETLATHGNAQTDAQAEAVSQALNEEFGNHDAVTQRARYLPAAVEDLAMRYVAEARVRLAPYTLALHLNSSPLPGQSGRALVTLQSSAGGVAAVVSLTHSANVDTPASVRTGPRGRGWFSYRTTDVGVVHIAAAATGPPTTVRESAPTMGTQLMLSWSPKRRVHATASYQGTVSGFAHRYECSSACDGHPDVTLRACATANSYPSRITFTFGAQTHDLSFPASTTRACQSWTGKLADGTTVTGTWRYLTPHGWTAGIRAPGTFTVDCPPVPPVAVALGYDCSTATLAITLGRQTGGQLIPLHNGTTHQMVLLVTGAVTGRFDVAPGADATVHSYPIACGTHSTVTMRSGIARSSGDYNYGQPATVMTP